MDEDVNYSIDELYKQLRYCLYISTNCDDSTSEIQLLIGKAVDKCREQKEKQTIKYCHPIEKNMNKRCVQTGYFCSECGKPIAFMKIQCECGCLIDWNEIDYRNVKE